MKKKLCAISSMEIVDTCEKNSNSFMGDCDKKCPFYDEIGLLVFKGKDITHCKAHTEYMKKRPNEEIELKEQENG